MAPTLPDLIEPAVLEEFIQSIGRCSGLPVQLIDPQGRVLVSSGHQDLCFRFHRRHPLTAQYCLESDAKVGELAKERAAEGSHLETHCRNGLNHIGFPIVVAKKHLATLFLSQFLYEPPDEATFRRQARELGFDEGEYLAALRKVPVLDSARVKEVMSFCNVLVRLVNEMGTREASVLASKERLRISEEKFRYLFQCANDALFIVGLSGRFLDVNELACARLGYSREELLRMQVKDIDPNVIAKEAEAQAQFMLNEDVAVFETEHTSRNGRKIPVEISVRKIEIEGRPAALCIARDLTERKKREEELLYRERFEALIAAISTRFMEEDGDGLDRSIESALDQLMHFAGVDRAYLFCLSEDGTRMSNTHEACTAGTRCEKELLQQIPVSDFPWLMQRLRARKIVHIPRIADLPAEAVAEKEHFAEQGIQSMLSVPVLIEGHLGGIVGFDAVHAEKIWDRRDIVLLRTFGDLLGSALERRRATEALEYRARLEHLIATLSTRIINLDADSIDSAIEEALAEIGRFVGVDRCYVFQYSTDGRRISNTHEWCKPGIESFKERSQEIPLSSMGWFADKITRDRIVLIPDVACLPEEARAEKEEFERQKIRSLLCVPMRIEERRLGFLGFDSVEGKKRWRDDFVLLLRLMGESFANALERRRRDRELRENRERIAAILRSLRAGLVGVDQEGRIVLLNQPAASILGVGAASAPGRLMSELSMEAGLEQQIASVLKGRTPGIVEFTAAEGGSDSERIFQARTDPVRADGKLMGAITLLRDVTKEREIDRVKNEFISTAAHELRTPLASVLGYSEILMNRETFGTFTPEQEREFLEEIHKKAESLTDLVNDLLDLSRIESGQLVRLSLSPTSVGPLIEEVVEDFRRRNPERRLEPSLPADLPEVPVDGAKIRQVLENLLGNAAKFSAAGSRIRVEGDLHAHQIEVSVTDEGVGMSPEVLSRIFEKFYRGTADHSVAGLGLGMSLVKNIVEAHGGEVRIESTRGIGTKVTFTLPLHRPTDLSP